MIHGVFYRNNKQKPQPALLDGTHPVLTIDPVRQRTVTWFDTDCWLAQSIDKNAPFTAFNDTPSPIQLVAWARLDNRDELINTLGIKPQDAYHLSDAQLILRTYLKVGDDCTRHLHGDFCFAIYNERTQTVLCVRDHMGTKPFYYYLDEDVFAFSSSLSLFHVLNGVPMKPSMEWACKFLVANLSMDFEKTAYHNIFKLAPAHQLRVSKRAVHQKRYFAFHTDKIQLSSSQAYVALYQEALERAIKCRIQTAHPLGSEISGGIDSSTVTAYAAKHFSRPLSDFYTFGFAHLEQEPRFILQVNQHYNIPNSYICCHNASHVYDPNRALQALGAPVEHSNATAHEIFYDMASKHQVRTLLSGFGGDEFVTSIHGDLYLYELLKNKKYVTLYNNLLGNPLMRALRFTKLHYYSDNQSGKINLRMRAAFASRWADTIVADELIHAYGIDRQYHAVGNFDHGYHSLDEFTLEKRWVPFVSTRMENCTLMAASYGIDYRWPLLDARLIQCFLSIPSAEKYHRGVGRYLHKRAIDGTVPKDIVWKQGKYMGEPVNQSVHAPPSLHDDLHPDLLPLLNMAKLRNQVAKLPQLKGSPSHQIKKNIHLVNQLDDWLKYYFKQGCHWEIA